MLQKRSPRGAESLKPIGRPSSDSPRVQEAAQPALTHDLSSYALPDWMNPNPSTQPTVVPQQMSTLISSPIRFVEESDATGLRFEFQHGDKMVGPGMRMFQFSGGGVGAVDYDRDGWPDVFVANVNENRLFHNNGDGTFSDVTQSAGIVGDAWTTSVACADFNGDTLPDFYVVNYLTGPNLLSRICYQADGTPRACTPHESDAAEDQLLLNLGNGQFQDVTAEAGVIAAGGKGRGVIAADPASTDLKANVSVDSSEFTFDLVK